MKRRVALLASCLAACSNPRAPEALPPSGGEHVLAVRGATVLPMDGSPAIERATVLVRGQRIAEVGPDAQIAVPRGATVIDGRGRFVMPGLADMHVHLRHAPVSVLADYLREGVTTVRDMNGRPEILAWREQIRAGALAGPTLVVAAPTLGNWSSPEEGYPTPRTAAEATAAVDRFAGEGYDLIKVYTFLPAELLGPIVEAARVHRLPVAGHVPKDLGLERALAAGMIGVEHLTGYVDAAMTPSARQQHAADLRGVFGAGALDPALLDRAVERTVASGVWNCPTLVFFDRVQPTPLVKEAWSQRVLVREGSRNRREILRRLAGAGARIVAGTDSDGGEDLPARAIHDELEAMQEAGMAPEAVLRAATASPAEMLGGRGEFGTVTARARADLLVLPCDPRRRLACVRAREIVIARGAVVAR